MDLRFSDEEEAFRAEVRGILEGLLAGEYADLRGRGGPGDEHYGYERRRAFERLLGGAGLIGLGWPKEAGGRGASLSEQVIFNEEYARAGAPGRMSHIGEQLLGPTLIAFGTEEQKRRFLPPILRAEELWCQGYSEPNAGSDLANVQTRAELDGDTWVITGQKIWTSLAHWSDTCFALCRTDPSAPKHKGLSYILVPMRQDGVEVRPIVQMNGSSEFSEVFFDGAKAPRENVLGPVNGGWGVAMATLSFERGVSTLGQQLAFQNELDAVITIAKKNGAARDPVMRHRLANAVMGLKVMRLNALRTLSTSEATSEATSKDGLSRAGMINKLYWATWHRDLGKLAMDVLGPASEIGDGLPYDLTLLQRLFLFTRADTIYAGSNEIQRNLIGERALGLPPEPKVALAQARRT